MEKTGVVPKSIPANDQEQVQEALERRDAALARINKSKPNNTSMWISRDSNMGQEEVITTQKP